MLISIFVYIQVLKIVCTFLCACFAYKIATSSLTPTSTYVIFMLGSINALCLQVYNSVQNTGLEAFKQSPNQLGDIVYQIFAAITFIMFMSGFLIKLIAIHRKTR